MTSPIPDLDRYADERLEGEIDDATWQTLTVEHGNALAIALQQAITRRAAVAELAQPPLPAGLRDKLLPPTAAPAPLRFPWRAVLVTAVAAGLLIAVLPPFHTADTERPPPVVAHEERSAAPSPSAKSHAPEAARAGVAFTVAKVELQTVPDEQVIAALADAVRADAARATVDGDQTTATTLGGVAEDAAVGPHAIALAWAPRHSDEGALAAGRSRDVGTQRRQTTATELDAAGPAPAPTAAAPPVSPAPTTHELRAEGLGSGLATAADSVVVILHNRTVSAWTVAADELRLEARDAHDTVVWHGRIDAIGSLTVEPGGFLSLTITTADWPPTTQTLRATVGDLSSIALPLVPTAD